MENTEKARISKKRRADDPNCPVCVYCGVRPGIEDEHVIARGFFPAPRPNEAEYIKVPACSDCNRGIWPDSDRPMSADEEYVRSALILEWNAGNHEAARRLADGEVTRSIERRPALKNLILADLHRRDMETTGGLLVPNVAAFSLDGARVSRVIKKIITGLYYHEFGQRLPDEFEVVVHALEMAAVGFAPTPIAQEPWVVGLRNQTQDAGPRRLGNGVFSYSVARVEGEPPPALWVISFYDSFHTLVVTRPETAKGPSVTST